MNELGSPQGSPVASGLFISGWGVHLRDLDAELGIRGNYRWEQPRGSRPPRWGYETERRDGRVQDSVEEVLSWIRPAAPRLHRLFRQEREWKGAVVVTLDLSRSTSPGASLKIRVHPEAISEIADLGLSFRVECR